MGSRAVELAQSVQGLVPPGQDSLPVFTLDELQRCQEHDDTISRIVPFVIRRRRPSRRERARFSARDLALMKQWERLKVHDGVLYRVIKDQFTKQRRQQFVLPESLKEKALHGQQQGIRDRLERYTWPGNVSFGPKWSRMLKNTLSVAQGVS